MRLTERMPSGFCGDALFALIFAAGAFFTVQSLPAAPALDLDSSGYLAMSPTRTAAYPLFLRLFSPEDAIKAQALIFLILTLRLGLEVRQWPSGKWLSPILIALLVFTKSIKTSHGFLMTESLFTSIELGILAEVLQILRMPHGLGSFRLGLLSGLSITLRPSSLAYMPLIFTLLLCPGSWLKLRKRIFSLLVCLTTLFTLVALDESYRSHLQGKNKTSLMGKHLFAKAAMIGTFPSEMATLAIENPEYAPLIRALEQDFSSIPPYLRKIPALQDRVALTPLFEACLEHQCQNDLRSRLRRSDADINRQMARIGLHHLLRHPGAYLELSLYHYLELCAYFAAYTPIQTQEGEIRLFKGEPMPFADALGLPDPQFQKFPIKAKAKPFSLLLIGTSIVLSFIAIHHGIRRRHLSPWLRAACLSALTIQSFMILTSLLGVAVQRYMTALWPCFHLMVIALLGWLSLKKYPTNFKDSTPPPSFQPHASNHHPPTPP